MTANPDYPKFGVTSGLTTHQLPIFDLVLSEYSGHTIDSDAMTIPQRLMMTFLIVATVATVCVFRIGRFYPEHSIPLNEVAGGLGASGVALPFVWMRRFTVLNGAAALWVPCFGWGIVAVIVWVTGERVLAALAGFLLAWCAVDWIRTIANAGKCNDPLATSDLSFTDEGH